MYVPHPFGVEADETEVELFHAWDVPLQGFNNDVLATGNISRTFQALLGADQYPIFCFFKLIEDALAYFEIDVSPDYEQWTFREFPRQVFLVHSHGIERGTTNGHFTVHLVFQHLLYLFRFPGIFFTVVAFHVLRNGTGFNQEHYLSDQTKLRLFLLIFHRVEIKIEYFMELFENGLVHFLFSFTGFDRPGNDFVFIACKFLKFAGNNGFVYQFGQVLLVVDVLIVFLDAEYGSLTRTETRFKQRSPPSRREWLEIIGIRFCFDFAFFVLVINITGIANHVDGVVVHQFKLAV